MRNGGGWLLAYCRGCALAVLLALVAVPALAAQEGGNAAAFDQLAGRLDHGEVVYTSRDAMAQTLAELHREVPPGDPQRELRWQYLNCVIGMAGDPKASIAYATRGLEAARRIGYTQGEANFLFCRGGNEEMLTDTKAALADYDAAIAIARRSENSWLLADGLTWRGRLRSINGDYAEAIVDLLDAQRAYQHAGATQTLNDNLLNIATAYRRLGEYAKARGYLDQVLAAAVARRDPGTQMVVHMELGFIALEDEPPQPQVARTQFDLAMPLAKKTQGPLTTASVQLGMAQVDNQAGHWQQALDKLDEASAGMAALKDQSNAGMIALQQGIAHAGLGQPRQAISDFDDAEQRLRASGNLRYYKMLLQQRAEAYAALGNTNSAFADLQHAIKVTSTLDRRARSDTATLMRYQFDAAQREQENKRLAAEQKLQAQQLTSLQRIRHWQQLALLFGALLVLLLGWLVVRQIRMARRLRQIADTDPLTGIANRRSIEWLGQRALDRAQVDGRAFAVALLDIDHFKHVNDEHGHQAGDAVLTRLAATCRDALRQGDVIGRIGGEEFVVLLPDASLDAAGEVAERLRVAVAALAFDDIAPALKVTISLGVTVCRPHDQQFNALVERADRALYRAKNAGRNQVAMAGVDLPSS